MRDLSLPYRLAVATVLEPMATNFYDEKRWVQNTDTLFGIYSTQQQTNVEDNDCAFISRCSIDIEIIQKTGSEVTKDVIDGVSDEVCRLLNPSPGVTPLASGNLQFTLPQIESIISRNVSITDTETVIVKIIRFVVTIIQQSN